MPFFRSKRLIRSTSLCSINTSTDALKTRRRPISSRRIICLWGKNRYYVFMYNMHNIVDCNHCESSVLLLLITLGTNITSLLGTGYYLYPGLGLKRNYFKRKKVFTFCFLAVIKQRPKILIAFYSDLEI